MGGSFRRSATFFVTNARNRDRRRNQVAPTAEQSLRGQRHATGTLLTTSASRRRSRGRRGWLGGELEESTLDSRETPPRHRRGSAEQNGLHGGHAAFPGGGLGLPDCNTFWGGQERHVSHSEDASPFFSTNRGDIHTTAKIMDFGGAFLGFTSTTMCWDGDGDGDGGRPAAKERRVGLETCASPLRYLVEGKCFDAL